MTYQRSHDNDWDNRLAPDEYDYVLVRGEHWEREVVYDPDRDGTPTALDGYTAIMQVRAADENDALILELTSAAGEILLDTDADGNAEDGTLTLTVVKATSEALTVGRYRYDLWVVNASSEPSCIQLGAFEIIPRVTVVP